ncbi:MAG: tetratricopeptide repeat protein [Ferruginibacter sp.]
MAETKVKVENVEVNPALERAKGFWAKFSRPIIYVGSAIILLIGGYYAYINFIKLPNQQKANDTIFPAENLFGKMAAVSSYSKDSVNIVLNGGVIDGEKVTGLLTVIKNYGGTPAGNRAQYITGACYLQLKDFDKAIKYLKEFDGNGANQIQSKAYLLLGDAYAEQKKTDDALSYYKKAGSVLNNDDATQKVMAMFTAAQYADYIGKSKDAIEILQDIKNNHEDGLVKKNPGNYQEPAPPVTMSDIDKYLSKLGGC